jgi:ABC-type sugar transport system substrate-binding protein
MTMRRVSVLLLAVVLTMMLSVGTALANQNDNYKVCHVVKGPDKTHYNLTKNEQNRELNRHPKDYAGACKNGNGGFKSQDIGRITASKF